MNANYINSDILAGVPGITMDMAARRRRGRKNDPRILPEVPLSSARTAVPFSCIYPYVFHILVEIITIVYLLV